MEYLPFIVTEYNDKTVDVNITVNSDMGHLYVRVGKLDISIKQSEDGQSVTIECTDAELLEQELGSMTIWYDDIQELPLNEDGTHPLKKRFMMELHNTMMGKKLIEYTIPEIHRQLERIADALEKANQLKAAELKELELKDQALSTNQ